MNKYEVAHRTVKAMKLADVLEAAGATAQDVFNYDETTWNLAVAAAGIRADLGPSEKSKELVCSLLASREQSAGVDPFEFL